MPVFYNVMLFYKYILSIFIISMWMVPTVIWFVYFPVWLPWKTLLSYSISMVIIFIPVLMINILDRISIILSYVIYAFLASVYSVHIVLYGMPISSLSIAAIYQTNAIETVEFIKSYVTWKTLVAVALCWIVPIPFILALIRTPRPVHGKKAWLFFCLLFSAALVFVAVRTPQKAWKYNPVYQTYVANEQYLEKKRAVASFTSENIQKVLKEYPVVARRKGPVTLVVVIGESAVRSHHGYYGYPRRTTPFMDARKDQLLIFTDMISAAPNTAASHTESLLLPLESTDKKLPVMKMLNAAGMRTWWITSQYAYDEACSPLPFLADEIVSLNSSVDKSQFFDEAVLPELSSVLQKSAGQSRAIFLNIMGSHVKYGSRYPQEFAYFKDSSGMTSLWSALPEAQEIINEYDNSIRYTDFILEQIIRQLETVPNSVLIYLSDHGQDVFDVERRYGHSLNRNCGVEIPFFLWMSPSFEQWRGEEIQYWKECASRPTMSNCLGFFIADVLDIQVESSRRSLSPLCRDWKPVRRVAAGYAYD